MTARACDRCGRERSTWSYVVDIGFEGGARQQRTRGGFATKREAVAAMNALQESVFRGTYVRPGGPLSAKTVHNVHRTLSRALSDAVADRLLASNPAAGQHRQPESPEMPTWSAEQLRAFLHFVADDPYSALWRLAATTGLRRGELAGLRWRDVDFCEHFALGTGPRTRGKAL